MGSRKAIGGGEDGAALGALEWARRFLPAYFSDDPAAFHVELMRELESRGRRLLARVAPRGHAKSTCCSLAYPLFAICERRHRNIVIVSHESSLATQFVRDIRDELESNEAIREAYGDLCAAAAEEPKAARTRSRRGAARRAPARRKWTEAKFTTTTGVTVQARGAGAAFRGIRSGPHRPDLIVCDDIEKDERVESAEQRRKLDRWLRRVVMPALSPEGRLVVVGSIIHHDSLLANLRNRERFPGWDYRVHRALEAQPREDGRFDLAPLWPARWPVDRLQEERRRIGATAFEQEYMANPIDEGLRVFRAEWLRRTDEAALARRDDLITLMAADPATGAADGDYFALWVGSIDPRDGVIHTRELTLERIGIVRQVERIVAAFERWRPVKVGIETVAYQTALRDVLLDRSRALGLHMPLVALTPIANKRARIEGTAPLYERGDFLLPAALSAEVESQFLHFPKAGHDDAPDVCAMGVELARSLRCGVRIEMAAPPGVRIFPHEGGW